MTIDDREKHFICAAVMQVRGRVQLEAQIDARFVIGVEDRSPASGEFGETLLDKARRTLGKRIE